MEIKELKVTLTIECRVGKRIEINKKFFGDNLKWTLTSNGYFVKDIEVEEVEERALCKCGRVSRFNLYYGEKYCDQCYYELKQIELDKRREKKNIPTKKGSGSTFLQSTDL